MRQGADVTAGYGQFTIDPIPVDLVVVAGDQWGPSLLARGAEALAQIEHSNRDPLMGSGSSSGDSWVKAYIGSQKVRLYR